VLLAVGVSCAGGGAKVTRDHPPDPCCATPDDVARLDGRRVTVTGIYRPRAVTMRPAAPGGPRPRTVAIETEGGDLMLGVYHAEEGRRPTEEIDRLEGRRVRVVGVVHARTPTQLSPDGVPMATMIGPYIGGVERVELAEEP
jgi:hypothetical protein